MKRATHRVVDAGEFQDLIQSVVGLPVSHAWLGAGTALFLELGRLRSVPSWSTDRRIKAAIPGLIGPKISEISVAGRLPELVVALSDGRWVHSFMTYDGQPAWVLFLPDGSWLTVEGGRLTHDMQNIRRRKHKR